MLTLSDVTDHPHQRLPFRGPAHTIEEMRKAVLGPRGEGSVVVHNAVTHIVRLLQPKDYLSEILAIRNWVAEHVRYKNDPVGVEYVQDPQRMLEDIAKYGVTTGDCFPEGTLTLRDDYRLVPVEELELGDRIWGIDDWVTVEAVTPKGNLWTDALQLNNGSQVLLTPDHHVYALACPQHGLSSDLCTPSRCGSRFRRVRIRVGEMTKGMRLTTPERIPYGREAQDPDLAYVAGLYISDGWFDKTRFCISGQDGSPKEEQKRAVEKIASQRGSHTLAVNDADWAREMALMGHRAPEKQALSLDLDEASAQQLLRGIMADSAKNTNGAGRTLTTTSYRLAVQARVLHKMAGRTCRWSFIERHGGLGENPIYRLGVRGERQDQSAEKMLRVSDIQRHVAKLPVWDIQTSDHNVYLPQHDVTVSQCDDISTVTGAMLRCLGRETEFITVGFGPPRKYSHVFDRAREPKSRRWIVCDPVAGTRENRMLSRVTTWKAWPID